MPGKYSVRLTVNGKTYTQPLVVRMDPRVTTPTPGLQHQFTLSIQAYEGIKTAWQMSDDVRKLSTQLNALRNNQAVSSDVQALAQKLMQLTGTGGGRRGGGAATQTEVDQLPLGRLVDAFTSMLGLLQEPDAAPTTQAVRDLTALNTALSRAQRTWTEIKSTDVPALNAKLKQAGLKTIEQ